MLKKHAASSRKQRGILDPAACSDHARQNFGCLGSLIHEPPDVGAFELFVEPLGVSKWADTFHHDSRYDVSKTLELYDAMYRHISSQDDPCDELFPAVASEEHGLLAEALEASQGSSVLVDDAAYASGLAESLSPS